MIRKNSTTERDLNHQEPYGGVLPQGAVPWACSTGQVSIESWHRSFGAPADQAIQEIAGSSGEVKLFME